MRKSVFYCGFALCISLSAFCFQIKTSRSAHTKSIEKPQPKISAKPLFVTYHLADVHLTSNKKWPNGNDYNGLYDLKSDYSIRAGDGPDGCEYMLTLRRGSSWSGDKEELRKVFRGVRLKLKTGHGVEIGDTPQEVEKKIGKPTIKENIPVSSKRDGEFETLPSLTYRHEGKRLYEAKYIFKNNKLNDIHFRDARMPSELFPRGGCP